MTEPHTDQPWGAQGLATGIGIWQSWGQRQDLGQQERGVPLAEAQRCFWSFPGAIATLIVAPSVKAPKQEQWGSLRCADPRRSPGFCECLAGVPTDAPPHSIRCWSLFSGMETACSPSTSTAGKTHSLKRRDKIKESLNIWFHKLLP